MNSKAKALMGEMARRRLENWKNSIEKDCRKAFWILHKVVGLEFDRAHECLNTAVQELLWQWRTEGPPPYVEHWAAYLANSAYHVHIRPPRKDAKLLVFMPPVADKRNPIALDKADDRPEPPENALRRDEFQRVWAEVIKLPKPKAVAVVLWALGFDFAEIAQVLEVSPSHARSLKSKGIQALRKRCG